MQWKCFDDAEAFGMTRSVRFGLVAAAVLGLAIAVRLVTLLAWPSVARPDEVFQSLEPAHRLVTGFGIVSWEWRDGIRSWLFPGAIAGLMELARHAGLATGGTLAVVAAAMAALALVPAAVALRAAHGMMPEARVLAMLCAAAPCVLWPDLVHLGPRTMTEVQGGHLLILAGALATPSLADHNKARWCAGLGAVLGLCFCLRFHLLPAMALVAWWRCRGDAAAWRALLAGVAGPLLCAGLLDWVTLGTPFQSVWKNFAVNVVEGRSETYGISPPDWYLWDMWARWGIVATSVVGLLFAAGIRRRPLFALLAGVVLLSHSVLRHKESSFVYAAVAAIMIVAGTGGLVICRNLASVCPRLAAPSMLAMALLWAGVSAGVARRDWAEWAPSPTLWAERLVRQQAGLCGLAFYRFAWAGTGGYTHLDRPVPIALIDSAVELPIVAPGVNAIVAPASEGVPGFELQACHGGACVWHRDGPCRTPVAFNTDTDLVRRRE